MSSTGQIIGYVAGAVIGFFTGGAGYVALGAAIGGAIGSAIDPPAGPKIEGPRLSDTKQQTSTYGAFITRTYGNIDVAGNVFWIENNALKEVSTTESQGGKGGGGAESTIYSYFGTFALGLCACDIGETKQLGRIWIRGKLWYDPLTADSGAVMASSDATQYFTFHNGADDQDVDVRMQATLGVNNVPAYRGLCYIVFNDLPLEDYGNSIVATQIKVEILSAAVQSDPVLISAVSSTPGEMVYETGIASIGGPEIEASAFYFNNSWDLATEKTRINYRVAGFFSPAIMDTSPLFTQINSSRPGKYSWLTAPLYHIGDNSGVSYGGNDYPMPISVAPSGIYDWCIDGLGECFLLYGDDTLYSATPGVVGTSVELPGAKTMYLMGDLFYVFSDGYTYVVDKQLNLLGTLANTLDLAWGSGDAYTWQAFGGSDGRVWFMECYGVANGNVARLNSSATAIEETFAITAVSTNAGRAAIYLTNGILTRAYVDGTADKLTIEKWLLKTLELQTVELSDIVSRECLRSGLLNASDIDVTALTQDVRGFKVSSVASIRSALDPLRACWPFDVVPSGYKIKFVPRGASSVATVDSMELDARESGSQSGVRITHGREMATQLPRRVEVTYLDSAREYDIGPAGLAERLNTDATGVEKIELPIVLTANEAQGKAETLLYLRWLERHDLSFVMPPPRLDIEVPDVVTITSPDATYMCRIAEMTTLPDGRIEAKAKLASTTIYSPPAVGQVGLSTGQVLTWDGPSHADLLDIPCVIDSMDQAGFAASMYGSSSGWPGGVLVRTDDGQNWTVILGFSAPGATVGFVYGAIGAGRTDIPDTANVLQAYFTSGEPTSVTESAIDSGSNLFAYGADQRWEIISARTVSDRADGGKDIYNLLRGRFGTEWAMTTHQDGDALILLDLNAQQFIAQNLDSIGISRTYRAITKGQEIASGTDLPFTYRGMNLECLSPCYLNGHRDIGNLNWTLTWTRRGRIGTNWRDYVDVPLGEASESYEVEIWSDSGYTTLKRTITETSPTATYTQAQQITDFGDAAETLFIRVYQLSANVGRGIPLQASISRGVSSLTDLLWNYVSSLLHLDLSYALTSTTFTDTKSSKTVTAYGGVVCTTDKKVAGSASAYFDGVGDYLSLADSSDWSFGTGDLTISCWVYPTVGGVQQAIVSHRVSSDSLNRWSLRLNSSDNVFIYAETSAGVQTLIVSVDSVTLNAWNHIEVNRASGGVKIWLNGENNDTVTTNLSGAWPDVSTTLTIGKTLSDLTNEPFTGYVDDLFILKGKARHTASFTPPIAPFTSSDPDWSYCVLCMPFDTATDNTVFLDQKAKVWTRSGSPTISATQSRYGGYSGSFGSGQYIYTPSHADFQIGSGNFCMEADVFWIDLPGGSTSPCAIFRKWSAGAGNYQFSADIYYEGGGNFSMRFSYSTTGSDSILKTVAISVPSTGVWTTYRWDRNGNTLRFHINGTTVGSFDVTGVAIYSGTADMTIGLHGASGATGYIDEARVTKESRSNGDYVVVAAPFPNE